MATRSIVILVIIAAIALAVPPFLPRSVVDLLVFSCIYSIAGLGVGLLLGQCGIANLGQSVFYALGAYATAYMTVTLGVGAAWGFLTGVILSGLIALVIGWPVLRLTGHFLALATLALGIVANALFYEWDWLTHGSLGFGGIPKLNIFGLVIDTPLRFYYLAGAVLALCLLASANLIGSRTGLMLRAMRDAPEAAKSLGINAQWLRTRIFILSGIFGSIAGSLFAHYGSFVNVQSFGIEKAIAFLIIPVLGGATSLPGVVIGALFTTLVPEMLTRFGDLHQVLFGLTLMATVVLMPSGLMGGLASLSRYMTARGRA